jgi:tRNA-specific 2-thiouridylase
MDDARQAFELHLHAPRGRGALTHAPHAGAAGGAACGDLIRIAVRVDGDRIVEAGFDASGCGAVQAAGSAVVALTEGRPFLEAARLTPEQVAQELGGLLPSKMHAATLAADALHRALGAAAKAECQLPTGTSQRRTPNSRPPTPNPANRTLVAMSGGVDSAVAALLALESGDEVVAVTLELWSDPENDGEKSCCSPQAVAGARALAHRMGLPHVTLDLREEFRREVVDDFVAQHEAGRTPNPCVRCNGLVRFGEMLRLADALGARRLATGHYARIVQTADGPLLGAAADPRKDQAYMLARLAPAELDRLWFPLEGMKKPAVRERARAAGLAVADKAESQDLCFLAGIGRTRLLERLRSAPARGGEVVSADGRVLARHDGHDRFTVGQRRGIGVAAGEPLYVVGKDPETGRVTVGPREALATDELDVRDVVLYRDAARIDRVKLRYRSQPVGCRATAELSAGRYPKIGLVLTKPFHAAAPGQVACLMSGDLVVGHGLIADKEIARAA